MQIHSQASSCSSPPFTEFNRQGALYPEDALPGWNDTGGLRSGRPPVAGNAEVTISVSVADDGGSPITGYTASCISESGNANSTSPTSPITVTGLTNGQSYVCIVYATNAIGNSPLSPASAAFAPAAPPFGC